MSQVKALVTGLVQNPGLLKDLVADPQSFARLAGLGEAELKTLNSVSCAMSGLMKHFAGPNGVTSARSPTPVRPAISVTSPEQSSGSGTGVSLAAIASLVTVAGTLAVVGTVSLVALTGNNDRNP